MFQSLFRPLTIDSIVGDIQTKITKLRDLADTKSAQADAADERAKAFQDEAVALDAEAYRAECIANKFEALLS